MQPEAIKEGIRSKFISLLVEAGTNLEEPELFRAWQAFKTFARTRVDQTHSVLLFECGPSPIQANPDHFSVNFNRFFYLEVEESWDDLTVYCEFDLGVCPEFRRFTMSISADVGTDAERFIAQDVEKFIAQVEAQEELWRALREHPTRQGSVYMGEQ